MGRPLESVRILDLCWVGAGSYTTRILADLGADVVKIESHRKVDGLRLAGPFAPVPRSLNTSGYFADRNASKRSVTVDLTKPAGQEIVLELAAECDVIANNFSPGVMDKFGLSAERVLRINPSIVYLAMSMMGSKGPHSGHIGYGLNISALAGLHHLSGSADRPPAGTGTHYPDHIPNQRMRRSLF
jgi:benzylsuccinate CoA-transferase BbsF subunit